MRPGDARPLPRRGAARRPAFRYEEGDDTFLWGRVLSIAIGPARRPRGEAVLDGARLVLLVPDEGLGEGQDAISYRASLVQRFRRRELLRALPGAAARAEERVGVTCDDWHVRQMRTRWGSCIVSKRRIWLSTELAAHPHECLDLVATHELCHLIDPHHDRRFYEELGRAYPGWERIGHRLRATPPLP